MIDVTEKKETFRFAIARGTVEMSPATVNLIKANRIPKGDVLSTARTSAILGVKKTSELIPFCHPIRITGVEISFSFIESTITIEAKVSAVDRTGVEMEALTAVTIAALTIYDMCKQVDKKIVISDIHLIKKIGGKSMN
ncbi:molybdenum cofactor biosynthesis protein C [Candidatus Desantisbacteria bacterium CG1_02_38_46]|uniref:cyclic pyranopterin monophosphate synthase n=3 Tax=unclassified Candidatus Desantisiibacteriota TaxID=3106372 RepID=A0A2H9PAS3_9BACT|nr:MAG: molybdenum cofactor biosynthesis protein C [Candidatus Desantisbacteria bacterium CG1_02_38_46]PIU52274.1 MAG: cyclic pyranopterin monophosphate synthase MoaC [Candidatus Desantisbacteria bacterium CG07_land_8_20_14_0_80_39_15]PIZ15673.1 MAG: cyclic pyranopterin monophosphate synthase MoaC [Candidatus Desantisbacteria bacterium CG_4_10_14_0_8_um_filter_39_17]